MAIRRISLVLAALLSVALQGCNTTPRLDGHLGEAVRANLSAQVIDPAASGNVNPANGVDGHAALATLERYQRSFKETDSSTSQPLVGSGTGTR